MRDGVDGDLVALVVELVDHGVVGVLVGDVEGGVDGAAVGVLLALECNSIDIYFSPPSCFEVDVSEFPVSQVLKLSPTRSSVGIRVNNASCEFFDPEMTSFKTYIARNFLLFYNICLMLP